VSYITELRIKDEAAESKIRIELAAVEYIDFETNRWHNAGYIATAPGYVGLHMKHHPMDNRDDTVSHVLDVDSARLLGLALLSASDAAEEMMHDRDSTMG
jgi:hypothetical protein